MNDSIESFAQEPPAVRPWLVLMHQLPPKPDYLRVKVRRRLQRVGAAALRNSVYVLPNREDTLEDFEWLAREIRADGGEATICEAVFLEGVSDAELERLFRRDRDVEYAELERAAGAAGADAARLRRRLEEIMRTDFFDAPGRAGAERAVEALERRAVGGGEGAAAGPPRGSVWVTRSGLFVDRIASAWLIRRFIDSAARFKFVAAKGYRPRAGEVRFDMYEGEYTHEGDRCTFETLLARFGLGDQALAAIGEIVHDIDCKDGKFGRPEAAGVASVIEGIALATRDDTERLERGTLVLEGLYARLTGG